MSRTQTQVRVVKRDGVQPATLMVAAVASAIAAIVTSHFWRGGTVLTAAMTPVIVSIVKELLARPIESTAARRSASRVGELATARRAVAGQAAARTETARRRSPHSSTVPTPEPRRVGADDEVTQGDVMLTHPRRTYGRPQRRLGGAKLKLAIVTGVLAFVIAAIVLTVPELVFGGAVSSHHRTTIFGGGSSQSSTKSSDQQQSDQSQGDQQQNDQGNPSQQAPSQTTPSQTPSQPSQQQQPPPSQPPSSGGGTPAPSAPATPAPSSP